MSQEAILLLLTMLGIAELRYAVRRFSKRLHTIEGKVRALETPRPDSWKHPTIAGAGLLLIALSLTGCASTSAPTTRSIIDQVRDDQVAAELAPSKTIAAAAAASAHAGVAILPTVERLGERHELLRDAVAAIAVVSLCLVGARWFPLLGWILKPLGAAAGLFAAGVFALRSLLTVPEWVTLFVLGSIAAVVAIIATVHAKRAAQAAGELSGHCGIDLAALSGKARRFVDRARAYRAHHLPAKG